MSLTIRPVRQEDLAALRNVIDESGLFPSEILGDMIAAYFAAKEEDTSWLTVEDSKGLPIAVAYYVPEMMTDGTWNLLLIAVAEEQRNKGVGKTLMAFVEKDLIDRGQRILLVETSDDPDLEQTRNFYRQIGYTEEARIRDFYSDGEGKVIFWKKLAS